MVTIKKNVTTAWVQNGDHSLSCLLFGVTLQEQPEEKHFSKLKRELCVCNYVNCLPHKLLIRKMM